MLKTSGKNVVVPSKQISSSICNRSGPREAICCTLITFKAMQVWSQSFHSVLRLEEMLTLSLPLDYFFSALWNFTFRGLLAAGYLLFTRAEAGMCNGAGAAAHRDSRACKLKAPEPQLLHGSSGEDKLMWNWSKPEHFCLVCSAKIIQLANLSAKEYI